jgi:23S rRNA (pseudouridine1915-N3)-methyltransferase
MRLIILAVGHKMPGWVSEGFAEYEKRMPREMRIELVEIKPDKRVGGRTGDQVREAERDRILAALPPGARLVSLDEKGELLTTLQWAKALEDWLPEGRDTAFVIGGADGLHPDLRQKAEKLWSLSKLTLPHGLVRVVLAEQLYRAASVIKNHPYHREG